MEHVPPRLEHAASVSDGDWQFVEHCPCRQQGPGASAHGQSPARTAPDPTGVCATAALNADEALALIVPVSHKQFGAPQ